MSALETMLPVDVVRYATRRSYAYKVNLELGGYLELALRLATSPRIHIIGYVQPCRQCSSVRLHLLLRALGSPAWSPSNSYHSVLVVM